MKSIAKFIVVLSVVGLVGFAGYEGYGSYKARYPERSPLLPSVGSPESRQAAFAAEFAKHPEAPACSTFKEVYVTTNGKKSIWVVECGDGLMIEFFVNDKGVIEASQAVGNSKSTE